VGSRAAGNKGGEEGEGREERVGGEGGCDRSHGGISRAKSVIIVGSRRGYGQNAEEFSESLNKITIFGIVVIVIVIGVSHHCAHADISMSGCNVGIHVYNGLVVGIVEARGRRTYRGT